MYAWGGARGQRSQGGRASHCGGLCPIKATLVISAGRKKSHPASTTIEVRTRSWNTPVEQTSSQDGSGAEFDNPTVTEVRNPQNPAQVADTLHILGGLNVSACPGATEKTTKILCPLFSAHGTWYWHGLR